MGVGLNSALVFDSALGVAANKVADAVSTIKGSVISEANDASKNEMMAQKAKMNAEQLKNLKLRNKKLRLQIKALKDKQILKKEEKPNE